MFVGFLGSQPVKYGGKAHVNRGGAWRLLRAAISILVGVTTLVFAIRGIFAWLGTGKWPGYRLLGLIEQLAGGPVLASPPWPDGFSWLQEGIQWILSVPVSLAALAVGAWVAWKTFPPVDHSSPTATPTAAPDWIRAAIRRTPGDSLAIVSRDCPRLFAYLEEALGDNPKVRVIVDRRWGDRRYHHNMREPERRRQDRRRRPSSTEAPPGQPDVVVAPRVE